MKCSKFNCTVPEFSQHTLCNSNPYQDTEREHHASVLSGSFPVTFHTSPNPTGSPVVLIIFTVG